MFMTWAMQLLIVATDRISALRLHHAQRHSRQGEDPHGAEPVLVSRNSQANFENHLIATDVAEYPAASASRFADQLARPIDAGEEGGGDADRMRGPRISGRLGLEGISENRKPSAASLCRAGLRQCDKLPEPIFTPATKEESGHDINISFEEAAERIGAGNGRESCATARCRSIRQAADYAAARGVIIADTKFEFGMLPGRADHSDRRSSDARQQPILAGRRI